MKKIVLFIVIAILSSGILAGCVGFGNEKQYNEGDWYGLAGSREVARIQQDKLALEKLKSLPIKGDAVMGYEGIATNLNKTITYNFILKGPETKSFLLRPGESRNGKLIPGTYNAYVYRGNRQIGKPWTFHVTPQLHDFDGKKWHWYVYME